MRRLATLLCTALAVARLCSQEIPAPERYAKVKRSIENAIRTGQAPALSIAVLERGELVWAEGFGTADFERKMKASADTIYRLASISKPDTATALMRLVERRKVELDKPINDYLEKPGVVARRGRAADMTVRRLANHTSGMPTHWSFFYGEHRPPPRAETIRRYGFAAWIPGRRTNYSNLAFGILDHVIARTSGKSYRDYLVKEVLDPLGMTHTDVGIRADKAEHAAIAYRREDREFVAVADYGFDHDGASAVRSSVRDLIQFARLQIGEGEVGDVRLLSREAILAMRQLRGRNAGSKFGVGWSVGTKSGAQVLSHTGGMPGVSTALEVFPRQGSAVAVLCNFSSRLLVSSAMRRAADIVLRSVDPERHTMYGTLGPRPPSPLRHSSEPAGRFRGKVVHPDGPITIELRLGDGGDVRVRFGETEVSKFSQRKVAANRMQLRFSAPFRTTASLEGNPILDLELERAPSADPDGWRGLLYASGANTLRLAHWVKLERAED